MYGIMLFLHLIGLIAWLGGWLAIIVMLLMLNKQPGSSETRNLAKRTIQVFSWVAYPSAFIVLISGVYMIVQMGLHDKPFWLLAMERGGGTLILLSLIIPSLMGRKVIKRLSSGATHSVKYMGYLSTMSVLMVFVTVIVLIVSLKI